MLKNIYAFIGPSGSGKSSIIDALHEKYGYTLVPSYTDRPKRSPDEDTHTFLSVDEFDKLENIVAYTEYAGHRYCATTELLEQHDLYPIDPDGIQYLHEHYKGSRPVKFIGIYASASELYKRMQMRGDMWKNICLRRKKDVVEFADMNDLCDVVIHNRDFDETVDMVAKIIEAYEAIGAEPENNIVPVTFISVWDGGHECRSFALCNTETREVFDIETTDFDGEHLDCEYIQFGSGMQSRVYEKNYASFGDYWYC